MLIFIDMIRTILFAAILMLSITVKGQMHPQQVSDTNNIQKKWFITKYAGISSGFVAFKGGSGSFLSVPLGLQVNRQLTNNLYAFGSVSVTPYIFHYNSILYQPAINKNNSLMQPNNISAYPEAKIGVMYINNERTFSISGSIGVSRSSYNSYSPFYSPILK
jgi:hypothetical protein